MSVVELHIGVLTVSDRASRGEYQDRSGPAIREYLEQVLTSPWRGRYLIVPDEMRVVERSLKQLVDHDDCCLVITSGGTGPALRDVTPEATEQVCQKMLPGFGEAMRQVSSRHVPTAILSRQVAGIRDQCLIVNLPGNPPAIQQCLDIVFPAIPECLDLIGGHSLATNDTRFDAYRHTQP